MASWLLACCSTAVFSLVAIRLLTPLARRLNLVDHPDDRKQHAHPVPLTGGLSIFISVLAGYLFFVPLTDTMKMFLLGSTILVIVGALDDHFEIGSGIRLIAQAVVTAILVLGAGSYINTLGNITGLGAADLGMLGYFFTFIAIVAAMNAFNMIDGIDGLLGCLTLNTMVVTTLLGLLQGGSLLPLPLLLSAALLPYLAYNLGWFTHQRHKIFMGDAGSMFIGFAVVLVLVRGTQGTEALFNPVTALWIIAIPLMDLTAITLRRIGRRQPPTCADRDHLHHLLMKTGFTPRQTLVIMTALAILCSLIGIAGEAFAIPEHISFVAFLGLFAIYYLTLYRTSKRFQPEAVAVE